MVEPPPWNSTPSVRISAITRRMRLRTTSAKGTNLLVVVDAGGNVIGTEGNSFTARLGLEPTVTLDLDRGPAHRQDAGNYVSDWYYGDLSDLRVNGIQVLLPDDDDDDSLDEVWEQSNSPPSSQSPLTVVVPRRARLGDAWKWWSTGTTDVKSRAQMSSPDKHVQTVNVGVFDLTITPQVDGQPTAVTDQVIRIEGSGFGERVSVSPRDHRWATSAFARATTGDNVRIGTVDNCVRTDTDGALSNSFKVPHNLEPSAPQQRLPRSGAGRAQPRGRGLAQDTRAGNRRWTPTGQASAGAR